MRNKNSYKINAVEIYYQQLRTKAAQNYTKGKDMIFV